MRFQNTAHQYGAKEANPLRNCYHYFFIRKHYSQNWNAKSGRANVSCLPFELDYLGKPPSVW